MYNINNLSLSPFLNYFETKKNKKNKIRNKMNSEENKKNKKKY